MSLRHNPIPGRAEGPHCSPGPNQHPADALAGIRNALVALSLSEETLTNGIALAGISDLKAQVNQLDLVIGSTEGRLVEWLAKEQAQGSVLYASAMINKIRNGALDASPSDPRSRTVIIRRFNTWAKDFLNCLEQYETSSRPPTAVAPWIANAEALLDCTGSATAG